MKHFQAKNQNYENFSMVFPCKFLGSRRIKISKHSVTVFPLVE